MQNQYEIWATFTNTQNASIDFMLEPWGEVYTMESQATFKLFLQSNVKSTPIKSLAVLYDVGSLTVYAWEGCIASLFNGEKQLR